MTSISFKSVHGVLCICTPPRLSQGGLKTPQSPRLQYTSARSLFATPRTPPSHRRTPADRFIPSRSATNLDFSSHALAKSISKSRDQLDHSRDGDDGSEALLQERMLELEGCNSDTRVLNFTPTKNKTGGYWESLGASPLLHGRTKKVKKRRKIPKSAEKVLDAPNLVNDFYLNVLDWSKGNQLAVALGNTVHVYSVSTGRTTELCKSEEQSVSPTALQWSPNANHIAIGMSDAEIQLWDVSAGKLVRRMRSHNSRVGCISWNPFSSNLLSSGSQAGHIHHYDVRSAQFHTRSLTNAHSMDVCGLKWSPSGQFLASGGNDNLVNVWDMYRREPWTAPVHTFRDHTAAVKAIAWCPWKSNLLATGGGAADKSIRIWNTSSGALQGHIQAQSQVCGLLWSTRHHELVSAHGYTQNHLTIWEYPTLSPIANLYGHEGRILHIAMSPAGETVVTAAADETLRFWRCFEPSAKQQQLSGSESAVSDLELKMLSLVF